MGLFDFLTGGSRPSTDRAALPVLRKALLALDRGAAPFLVRDGAPDDCDLVAEWRIADARWYEVFAKAGVKRVFKVLMTFDAEAGQVRATDQEWSVEWRAGVPELSLSASAFRGQKWEAGYEAVYAFREDDLSWGKIYSSSFRTDEIKGPLKAAAKAAGWGWRDVAFGKL